MSELTFFFKRGPGCTIGEITALTGATPVAGVPLDTRITGIAPLDTAGPRDLAYMDSGKYARQFSMTRAGACLVGARFVSNAPDGLNILTAPKPYSAFVTVARKLFPEAIRASSLYQVEDVAPGATVHPTARVEQGVTIEHGAVVGPGAEIGANTIIGPTAVIGGGVRIGRDCAIGAGVVITHALIGDRVVIHSGCRIGQDGFGYNADATGLRKIPQIGRVIIQDDVELGANTTIDRGSIRDTIIGEGTKIDNLVQIGHNCVIGRHCLIVSQTGLSGSVTVGDRCVFGGQVGIADNLTIGEDSQIAAKAGVMSNLPPGGRWAGAPAVPIREFMRAEALRQKMLRPNAVVLEKESGS